MRDKKYLWAAVVCFLLCLIVIVIFGCTISGIQLQLGPYSTFVTHNDGRTEIKLTCLNLSDSIAHEVVANVTVGHMQTDEVIDKIIVNIGDILPRGMKDFSAWTDKLTFGDDVGVKASFTYKRK